MWRSGPPRGCDAALRPRGRAASGPRGVQEAHSGAATWQGGHATTWAPVWGATCRLVIEGDGDEINRRMHPPPPFNRNKHGYFLCVGLCSHTVLPFAGDVVLRETSDSITRRRDSSITWTRVHAITNQGTCTNDNLSDLIRRLT